MSLKLNLTKQSPKVLAMTTLLVMTALTLPAIARQRICVVDERSGTVACGRPASNAEVERYYGRGTWNNGSYRRDGDRYDRGTYNDREAYDQINRLFQDILGRNGDFNSIRGYASQLQGGRSLQDIRREMARSGEAAEAIRRAYREILGREADPGGFAGYQRNLENGWSLNQIRSELANSQEARNRR